MKKDKVISLRLTEAEKAFIESAAELVGQTPSQFLRESALLRAERVQKVASNPLRYVP